MKVFQNLKKISIHYQYLQQLDELIIYNQPINIKTLKFQEGIDYLNNIENSINEIKILFNSLYSNFQAYSIASGNLSRKSSIYNDYLFQFNDIYLFNDEFDNLNSSLSNWYAMHSKAIGLANMLRELEIEPLIKNLKVK